MPVDEEDIPLMNASVAPEPEVNQVDWEHGELPLDASKQDGSSDGGFASSDEGCDGDQGDAEVEGGRLQGPDEEGKFHDDPLWWGKTLAEIRHCTEDAKREGNKAHTQSDPQLANRHWKGALKGAQKLKDSEAEFRLRLNLAMGYTKLGKTSKALDHCRKALGDSLRSSVPSALQAKAHFRRAEALEVSGEVEKALVSLRAALEIEPGNADMRHKYTELKRLELERRKREKAFFSGKQLLEAMSDKADPRQASDEERLGFRNEGSDEEEVIREAVAEEMAAADAEEPEKSEDDEDNSNDNAYEEAADFDASSLTDRSAADDLFQRMNGGGYGGCIDFVGQQERFLGPVKVPDQDSEPS